MDTRNVKVNTFVVQTMVTLNFVEEAIMIAAVERTAVTGSVFCVSVFRTCVLLLI